MPEAPKEYKDQKIYNVAPAPDVDHLPKVRGYDFEKPFNINEFLKSYGTTGFQAAHLGRAMDIIEEMRKENATIFLGYTSNMVTSGIREVIKFLVKHKMVHVLVTTAGGIEEDMIKCLKPFAVGIFNVSGRSMYEKGINRTGNIFIPNDRYLYFEKFINPFLDRLYKEQKEKNVTHTTSDICRELGKEIASEQNHEDSILYWAAKNNIPVFCPAITDGSFGDLVYFMKQRHPDFKIEISGDTKKIVDIALNAEKSGTIILGAGLAKHYILNANIFRDGAEYAVYINTADEFDGSDSGAMTEEAITWGKIKANAQHVKVHGDATIIFPLLVAGTFGKKEELNN
ncbi:deoxyhypusine synthase [Candidatus Woesearchaeota archaeon]|nr:deoxyhypusine synthase [Candidatus Woesearchaeota archaeon]